MPDFTLAPMTRGTRPLAAVAAMAVLALAACASVDPATPRAPVVRVAEVVAIDLAAGRRCMDTLLLDQGPRELALRIDDATDAASRGGSGGSGGSGTSDMLVAALSDMTQRSRALRVFTAGKAADAAPAGRVPATGVPQYSLRGSISQSDAPGEPRASALGLDLVLTNTRDMSVVPGTTSHNTAAWFARGTDGGDRVEFTKFGARFGVATVGGSGDGRAQARRALVDVAAIELVGRLARVPYWTCFGATTADPKIAAEVQDWYDIMAARPAEIIGYFQHQLRLRRVYDGPVDGIVNPPLKEAVAGYRELLGLSREPKLSLDFFQAYLGADHHALEGKARPADVPGVAAVDTPPTAAGSEGPLSLRIASGKESRRFARGEAVDLTIQPNRDAHVYCFHQDEKRRITRFFPNRFQSDSRVGSSTGLKLPGAMRFEIVMNARGTPETVACFATESDVLVQLPADVNGADFAVLPIASLDQVRFAFQKLAGTALAQDWFQIRPR